LPDYTQLEDTPLVDKSRPHIHIETDADKDNVEQDDINHKDTPLVDQHHPEIPQKSKSLMIMFSTNHNPRYMYKVRH
jgi:hypothetical protein